MIFFWIAVVVEFLVGAFLYGMSIRHAYYLLTFEWRQDLIAKAVLEVVFGSAFISIATVSMVIAQ